MTPTDELRRMLDERGVEWYEAGGVTFFGTSGYDTRYAASEPECGIALDPLTPEQAIAATVGRETCHDMSVMQPIEDLNPVDGVVCKKCGMVYRVVKLDVDDGYLISEDEFECVPNFCPRCGAKVIE